MRHAVAPKLHNTAAHCVCRRDTSRLESTLLSVSSVIYSSIYRCVNAMRYADRYCRRYISASARCSRRDSTAATPPAAADRRRVSSMESVFESCLVRAADLPCPSHSNQQQRWCSDTNILHQYRREYRGVYHSTDQCIDTTQANSLHCVMTAPAVAGILRSLLRSEMRNKVA